MDALDAGESENLLMLLVTWTGKPWALNVVAGRIEATSGNVTLRAESVVEASLEWRHCLQLYGWVN